MSVTPHTIRPRSAWTDRPPGGTLERLRRGRFDLVVHYSDGDGRHLDTLAEQKAAIRAMRDFHVNVRGWSDLAYNTICTQPWGSKGKAGLWVGRGMNRVPAAQEGHNVGHRAVCVIADEDDFIMRRTVEAIAYVARFYGARRIMAHRDFNSTSCPGDRLYAQLPLARRLAGL